MPATNPLDKMDAYFGGNFWGELNKFDVYILYIDIL